VEKSRGGRRWRDAVEAGREGWSGGKREKSALTGGASRHKADRHHRHTSTCSSGTTVAEAGGASRLQDASSTGADSARGGGIRRRVGGGGEVGGRHGTREQTVLEDVAGVREQTPEVGRRGGG
jgi:hypothetical protein